MESHPIGLHFVIAGMDNIRAMELHFALVRRKWPKGNLRHTDTLATGSLMHRAGDLGGILIHRAALAHTGP